MKEFEAITGPGNNARGQLSQLLRGLHKAVTEHIGVLNECYSTVTSLRRIRFWNIRNCSTTLEFWLPSASVVNTETAGELYESAKWFISQLRFDALIEAVEHSVAERGGRIGLVMVILLALLIKRKAIKRHLLTNNRHIGNVGHDRTAFTLMALINSALLAPPGVLGFSLAALLLMEGNSFYAALSNGFTAAAFIMFLLALIRNVARKQGLGESHFHWNANSLRVIRRELPRLYGLCNSCGCYYHVNKLNAGRGAI